MTWDRIVGLIVFNTIFAWIGLTTTEMMVRRMYRYGLRRIWIATTLTQVGVALTVPLVVMILVGIQVMRIPIVLIPVLVLESIIIGFILLRPIVVQWKNFPPRRPAVSDPR